jgi:hypothetical protein
MIAGSFASSLNIALLVHAFAARHSAQQRHFSARMKDLVMLIIFKLNIFY